MLLYRIVIDGYSLFYYAMFFILCVSLFVFHISMSIIFMFHISMFIIFMLLCYVLLYISMQFFRGIICPIYPTSSVLHGFQCNCYVIYIIDVILRNKIPCIIFSYPYSPAYQIHTIFLSCLVLALVTQIFCFFSEICMFPMEESLSLYQSVNPSDFTVT